MPRLHWFGLLILQALMGCRSTPRIEYAVTLNSLAALGPSGKRYVILPTGNGASTGSLEFAEYAGYVHGVLREKGYVPAASPVHADLIIHMSYGVKSVKTGMYVTSSGSAARFGNVVNQGGSAYATEDMDYVRWVELSALDMNRFRKDKSRVEVWNVSASSQGAVGDLRRVFPALVAVAREFIGRDSRGAVSLRIVEGDGRIAHVRARRHTPKFHQVAPGAPVPSAPARPMDQ